MNPRVLGLAPSLIRAIHDRKRPDAIDLGMGQPTLMPDMGPLEEGMAWVRKHGCPYSPNAGFADLRAAIAGHFHYPGLDTADQALITVGSTEALYLAIKGLLDPEAGEELLVVGPTFPAYQKMGHMEGIPTREVILDPAKDFAPSADRVLSALSPKTRLLALASPCNPTGRIWPEPELARLADGLLHAPHPIFVLWDEVYRDLYYTPTPPPSLARFYPRTLVAGSLSKSCALTGLRLGWLLAPSEVFSPVYKVHQLSISCAETLAQRAALAIFARPELLSAHRAHYQAQQSALCKAADELGLSLLRPEGTFYSLLRLPPRWAADSYGCAMGILEQKNVVTIPGSAFGAEGFLRLTFVAPIDQVRSALARIAEFFAA
jgi:aminotransferase